MPGTASSLAVRALAAFAIIAASSAIFAWIVVKGTGSYPNWFGTYDWTKHDQRAIAERDRKRVELGPPGGWLGVWQRQNVDRH
jgi:hypothetical protein